MIAFSEWIEAVCNSWGLAFVAGSLTGALVLGMIAGMASILRLIAQGVDEA